ncbi:MAG: AI-2E family transporter, partial [Halothiobacillaceae bacterium]
GLHPVTVIFAIMAGGQLFGFTGVLMALPVAAVLAVLIRHAHQRYKASSLYGPQASSPGQETEGGATPLQATADEASSSGPPAP